MRNGQAPRAGVLHCRIAHSFSACYHPSMPAIVTKDYRGRWKRFDGRFWKDEAHARLRTEERRYLAHQDWDDVIQTRPVTNYDVD